MSSWKESRREKGEHNNRFFPEKRSKEHVSPKVEKVYFSERQFTEPTTVKKKKTTETNKSGNLR